MTDVNRMNYIFVCGTAVLCLLGIALRSAHADIMTFSNTAAIAIPDVGMANPYPTTIDVTGISGQVSNFTLTITGITHNFSDDMSAAIVSPRGTAVLLFAGPGANFLQTGRKNVFDQTWTFDDNAPTMLPETTQPVSGTYRPGLFEYDDDFPAPGPGAIYGFTFAPYLAEDLNGQWRLFIMDANSGDAGNITGGWSMSITTTVVPEPSTVALFTCMAGAAGLRRLQLRRHRRKSNNV